MKKGEAKVGDTVRITNLNYLGGVTLSEQQMKERTIGNVGTITAFVPGYGGNVCVVQRHESTAETIYSYLEFEHSISRRTKTK